MVFCCEKESGFILLQIIKFATLSPVTIWCIIRVMNICMISKLYLPDSQFIIIFIMFIYLSDILPVAFSHVVQAIDYVFPMVCTQYIDLERYCMLHVHVFPA